MPSDNDTKTLLTNQVLPLFDHVIDLLNYKSQHAPTETALTLIADSKGTRNILDWQTLADNAKRAANSYQQLGLKPGDRVIIALPTGEAFLAALFGAIGSGLTPTAIAPFNKLNGSYGLSEWHSIISSLTPSLIVGEIMPENIKLPFLTADSILNSDKTELAPYPDLPFYVQLSSGSTGTPKGVLLYWSSVRANLIAMSNRIPLTSRDHMFSWLPMYHDMGLFGTLLTPLMAGGRVTLMDPKLFIAFPMLWLNLMAATEATITSTPPSALHLCLQILKRRPANGLDLSKLEKVICGSEPVTATLIREFEHVLTKYGVNPVVLKPVYGLAENTLAVSIPYIQQSPRIERFDRSSFESRGALRKCDINADDFLEEVAVGCPLEGVNVEIRDTNSQALAEDRIGAIWLNTPSLLDGTLKQNGQFEKHSGWFNTGDIGFINDGELFITGRHRDIIIKNGRNYSPERFEELTTLHEDIYRAAAFGIFQEKLQSEKVVILAEIRKTLLEDSMQRDTIKLTIRSALNQAGYPIDEIRLVEKGSLSRTTSGKIRRQACRLAYISGEYDEHSVQSDIESLNL